jgi:hypothetical protein
MNRLAFALTIALAASAGVAAQPAATLASAKGSVLVNQGKQFVSAQPGQLLTAGDRVMIMQGGSATLRFADGCVKNLDSGSMLLVQNTCNSSSLSQVAAVSAQALGEERDCDDDETPDSKDDDIDGDGKLNADDTYENCKVGAMIWVAGGVGLAASAALISDGDDDTISP